MTLRNTTPVPNIFFEQLMAELSGSAVRVYLKIIRNTLGWRNQNGDVKGRDWIAHSQFEKVGLSNRSVTNAIEELLEKDLICVTDFSGNDLSDATNRKNAKRVFYNITQNHLDNPEKTTLYNAKTDQKKPQNLRTTKDIFTKEYSVNNDQKEKITDHFRIQQIKEEQERRQVQRDRWV